MNPITKCEVCGSWVRVQGRVTKSYVPVVATLPSAQEFKAFLDHQKSKGYTPNPMLCYEWLKSKMEMK